MRSVPFPGHGVPPARYNPLRNPHWAWWLVGGFVVLAGVGVGIAGYWWRRRPPSYEFEHGYLKRVSCDRHAGHVICIWKTESGMYLYNVNGGAASENFYSSPVEAAAAGRIFIALLSGDVGPAPAKDDDEEEEQVSYNPLC